MIAVGVLIPVARLDNAIAQALQAAFGWDSGLLLTGMTRTTPLAALLPAYFVFGIGFGMVNPPITNTAVLGMPEAQAGVAAAVASTSRQVGQTLGVAVAGAVAAAGAVRVEPGFVAASTPVWWLIAACGATIVLLGALSTTDWANATARRALTRPALEASGAGR